MLIVTPSLLLLTSKLNASNYMVVLGLTGHFVFEKALRLFSIID